MATVTEAVHRVRPTEGAVLEEHKLRPVIPWAVFGAACIGLQTYAYTRWILGPDFHRTPSGPTPIPTFMRVAAWTIQIAGVLGVMATLYFLVYRQWKRNGRRL